MNFLNKSNVLNVKVNMETKQITVIKSLKDWVAISRCFKTVY